MAVALLAEVLANVVEVLAVCLVQAIPEAHLECQPGVAAVAVVPHRLLTGTAATSASATRFCVSAPWECPLVCLVRLLVRLLVLQVECQADIREALAVILAQAVVAPLACRECQVCLECPEGKALVRERRRLVVELSSQ